ncbi:MAG: hypothetical protein ACYC2O_04225, partial [Microthrixaceae bacterium]
AAGDDAFIAWEQANLGELEGRALRAAATADAWSREFDSGAAPSSMQGETTAVIEDLNALVDLVGTAPESTAKSDALRYLVTSLASFDEISAYLSTGDEQHRVAGLSLLEQASADFDRSAATHADRVWFFSR